jgi:hypothetical protein
MHNVMELYTRIYLKLNHEIYICKSCMTKLSMHLLSGLYVKKWLLLNTKFIQIERQQGISTKYK